jgi:hypothetical protein
MVTVSKAQSKRGRFEAASSPDPADEPAERRVYGACGRPLRCGAA